MCRNVCYVLLIKENNMVYHVKFIEAVNESCHLSFLANSHLCIFKFHLFFPYMYIYSKIYIYGSSLLLHNLFDKWATPYTVHKTR